VPHSQAAEAIPHLYKQEREHPTLVWRQLSQTQVFLGGSLRAVGDVVRDENAESCGVVCPLRIPSVIRTVCRTCVVVVR